MNKALRLFSSIVVASAIAVGSFAGGYVVGRDHPDSMAAVESQGASRLAGSASTPEGVDSSFAVFWEAWRLVQQEYYNRAAVDSKKMTYGAIEGMVSSLGDPHTSFSTPQEARVSEDDLRGSFEGIGVTVEMKDGKLTVVAPLADSPGAKAGILPGDVVTHVDGRDISGLDMLDAISLIRGPRGTKVHLTIAREGKESPLEFDVERAEIKLVSVQSRMLDGDFAYVSIASFGANTSDELVRELRTLLAKHPKGLVLDLRNNPGGLLTAAVDVSSQFLSDGVVLYEQRADKDREPFKVKEGGVAKDVPMVVLINKGSASASEIVAGALQDYGRAKLVGEPTFGKDTVQNVHQLSDQSSLRVTIARWYTPKLQDIHEKGLKPDIEVTLDEKSLSEGRDLQLERAIEQLKENQGAEAIPSLVEVGLG